jgi:hypothetical protein
MPQLEITSQRKLRLNWEVRLAVEGVRGNRVRSLEMFDDSSSTHTKSRLGILRSSLAEAECTCATT